MGIISSEEWLEKNNKYPWHLPVGINNEQDNPNAPFWYWRTYLYYNDEVYTEDNIEPYEKHYTLPIEVWNHLQRETSYPYVKMYETKEDALNDFHQAYTKMITK
jgi:hypothetical protein